MTGSFESTQSVRHYFARLSLHREPRAALQQWQHLGVESFFVALSLPHNFINPMRKECGAGTVPLATMFAGVRWS